jgi:hypothetical protein
MEHNMKKSNLFCAMFIGSLFASSALANSIENAKITQMLTTDEDYAGCMIKLDKKISVVSSACPNNWLTFSCNGDLGNSVQQASMMWEQAQMAYVLNKMVRVKVDSSKKANGYCYASYIRVQD